MITCRRLRIVPQTAKNALNFNYELALDREGGELNAVAKLTHHLKTDVRKAALELKQNRIARGNKGLDEALVLDEQLQQRQDQLGIESQNEKRREAEVKKFADQMRIDREKREESLNRKIAAIEEVEIKIRKISNEDNLPEEESVSRQRLLDLRKTYVVLRAADVDLRSNSLQCVLALTDPQK
jgi:hypothetical protein